MFNLKKTNYRCICNPIAAQAHNNNRNQYFDSQNSNGMVSFTPSSSRSGLGENIAFGQSDMAAAIKAWYDEVDAYTYQASFDYNAGYYTQIVWAGTRYLGCGQSGILYFGYIYNTYVHKYELINSSILIN